MSLPSAFTFRPPTRQRLARQYGGVLKGLSESAGRAFLDDAVERARVDELARLARLEIDPAALRPRLQLPRPWADDVRASYAEACLRTVLALERAERSLAVAEIARETIAAIPIVGPTCHAASCHAEIEPWAGIALNEYDPRREMILLVSRGREKPEEQMLFRLPLTVPTATLAKVASSRAA